MTETATKIKAYTQKELLNMYEVTWKTFSAWIKPFKAEIGDYNGRRYTVKQVRIIFEQLGEP